MAARTPRAAAAAASSLLSPTPRSLGSTGTPVLAECPSNDDERERRQRRRSRAVDSSLQGLGSPSLRSEGWQPPLPQWTNAQISEHYSTCIKLSTENKITTKNAFGLHLIDYMTDILKQKNSELTNFQVAAGTLDASAKIYAVRVDSVHADAFRVLGHLGQEPAPAREQDSPEEGSSPAPEGPRKAPPRKKQNFRTIEQNLSNITVPEAARRPQVDPMFQRAATSFDECSAAGIFLVGLRSQSFRSRLLFPSGIVPLPSQERPARPSADPVSAAGLGALLAPCLEKRRICSSLAGFLFTKWDEESHDEVGGNSQSRVEIPEPHSRSRWEFSSQILEPGREFLLQVGIPALQSVSALLEKFRRSEQAFDPNLDPDSEDGEGWAPSQPEFQEDSPDGEGIQEFQENGDSLGTLGHSRRSAAAPCAQGDIGALSQHLSLHPGEYSYFSPRTLSMWAGPEHWRFRPRRAPASGSEKESRRRIPRKVFELDFQEDVDFQAHFRKTKAPTTLAKSILESQNIRSTTLPADFNYDPRSMAQLFLKPLVQLSRSSDPVGTLDNEAGIEDYDYNNPNDTSNFCPAPQAPPGMAGIGIGIEIGIGIGTNPGILLSLFVPGSQFGMGGSFNPISSHCRDGNGEIRNGNGEIRNWNGEIRNGNGEIRNGNGEIWNGNGEIRNGNGEIRNGNGEIRNGNGEIWNGNGEIRNGNGEIRNGTGKSGTGMGKSGTGMGKSGTGTGKSGTGMGKSGMERGNPERERGNPEWEWGNREWERGNPERERENPEWEQGNPKWERGNPDWNGEIRNGNGQIRNGNRNGNRKILNGN
ncbi:hypothetical protein DUI87_32665 [Hirundo rustica rustica]|uniref:Condensin complex subunit 2 n=1 Tax=Hirundo rustica rustica TaxID=333673 RepID=A0A3M0IQ69_HIRRU|nr:hypothetical protein DUI87_32665 [Hirundo rustica rustica]